MVQQSSNLMLIDDLMRDLMSALGKSHAEMAAQSQSPLGTLAVKTVDMTLDFDLSAEASENKGGFSLQIRPTPFFGLSPSLGTENKAQTVRVNNHAQVTLHIVNVAPFPEIVELEPVTDTDQEDKKPDQKEELIKALIEAIRTVHIYITSQTPLPKMSYWNYFDTALKRAANMLDAGNESDSKKILIEILPKLIETLNNLETPIPANIIQIFTFLYDWLKLPQNPKNIIPARKKEAIKILGESVAILNVSPAAPWAEFTEKITLAKNSHFIESARAVLTVALRDIRPYLTGLVLPRRMIDALEELDLLIELSDPQNIWRQRLEKPLVELQALIGNLHISPPIKGQFTKSSNRILVSQSELEAASLLVEAIQDFKRRTADQTLPVEIRQVLDQFDTQKKIGK